MQHTISGMARYIRNIIQPTIPKNYPLKPMFAQISDEENIYDGVVAFRDLLYSILDRLVIDGDLYGKPSKSSKDNVAHPSLPVSCPFLNNVKSILFNIGYHGKLMESGKVILINDISILTSVIGPEGNQMKAKISGPKLIKALRFLTLCGVHFDDIDLESAKLAKSNIISLKISYPDNHLMLTGLKVMAVAQRKLYTKGNHDIFLRCDYRVLKDRETEIISILSDFVVPLPDVVQDFTLKLHQHYLDSGLTCRLDIFYLGVRFIYSHKNKEIFTFSAAHESGYRLLIKAQKTHLYADIIDTFPLALKEKISLGYGCNKKLFGEQCQKGCHGFSFPLDDSITDISRDIEVWLDTEVSCLRKKSLHNSD